MSCLCKYGSGPSGLCAVHRPNYKSDLSHYRSLSESLLRRVELYETQVKDLKARLKHVRQRGPHFAAVLPEEWEAVLDLRVKNWRDNGK